MVENNFTIKDLENLSGIKAHTIRIWEQRYSLIKPSRTDTNIRYYSNEELKKLLNIALLNKYGFKISHIDKMNDREMNDKILTLNQAQAQQERVVNELIQHMVDLQIEKFGDVLNTYIASKGIERTIPQIIFPFLEKIGILWLTNHINPAQEHLVSNIIRQKIIVGIDSASSPIQIDKRIVLFLPEGEYHELGLLFMHFMLKNRGIDTIYLGCSVPLKDLQYVVESLNPDYLYTHLTTVSNNFNIDKYLTNFSKRINKVQTIISGQKIKGFAKSPSPTIQLKHSFSEVMEFVSSL